MTLYLRLYWEFFKTGLFAIGGGMATLPFLKDIGASTGWFTQTDLMNMLAVSESTPGPLGVNMATYVGYLTAGIPGAVAATIGLVAPSVIVILIVAAAGLSVVGLALLYSGQTGLAAVNWKAVALAAVLLVLTRWCKPTKGLHPIVFILASAIIGVVFSF